MPVLFGPDGFVRITIGIRQLDVSLAEVSIGAYDDFKGGFVIRSRSWRAGLRCLHRAFPPRPLGHWDPTNKG